MLDESGDRRSLSITRGHVDALTGLRGFAALVVLTVHVAGRTDYAFVGIHGYGPVSLFVLSGFLLYRPWSRWALGLGAAPSIRTFVRHRLARILPAYLVVVLIVAVVLPESQPTGVDGWLRALTLTHTTATDGLRPGMEHTWSLGTEVKLVRGAPLRGAVRRLGGAPRVAPGPRPRRPLALRSRRPSVRGLALVARGAGTEPTVHLLVLAAGLHGLLPRGCGHLPRAAGGPAGLARSRVFRWLGEKRPWVLVGLAVVVLTLGNSPLGGPWDYVPATFTERQIRFTCVTMLALLLLVGAAVGTARSPVTRVMSMRWLVAMGRWSYSIYLWHLPVIVILAPHVARDGVDGFLLFYGLTLAITVPLGAATYVWVERPAILWSKRPRPGEALVGDPAAAERTA